MTPPSAIRSFAITLAIAIATVGPRASGFTIHRTDDLPVAPSIDLSTGEERLLQVNDTRTLNDDTTKNEDSNITTTTSEAHYVDKKDSKTTETVTSTPENEKIPTISSDTVEVFDSVEDTRNYNKTKTEITNSNDSTTLSKTELSEKPDENTKKSTEIERPVEISTAVVNISTKVDHTGNLPTRKTVERSIESIEKTTPLNDVTVMPLATEPMPTMETIGETADIITEFPSTFTDRPVTASNFTPIATFDVTLSASIIVSSDMHPPPENLNTMTTELFTVKYPKYTTIFRKQTNSSEEITPTMKPENNDLKTETSNTQVNFEKAFDITPIPSLEKLRADFLSNANTVSIKGEVKQESEKVTREILTTPSPIETIEPAKPGSVETKRAGYLDNSEKPITPVTPSENVKLLEVSDTYGKIDESAPTQTRESNIKKVSGSESQSQLAEDALQEELLKEEAMKNYKENAIRYQDDRTGTDVLKLDVPGVPGASTEDSLSVQPIERAKTTLYTVSPNYKPMKKIDVQPAKAFVRDPDDNSWRNESISSLGIVFKPKNSSKSFKEVLRNKTQTELNNLVERSQDNIPDLRVRLEKIAEVRKTKKKKMNKYGEMIYTDYEENSAETSTAKPEEATSILNSAELAKMFTPLNSQPGFTTKMEFDNTTPMTTVKDTGDKAKQQAFDFFSRLSLSPLTTQKPKKYFNMAEYYDTTDEYDADYATMSKLDLKKFTLPPRTPSPAPASRPVGPYFPERKPTVQYFPPRRQPPPPPPPPVNVNNVDEDFERKIKMFTFKDHPRIEQRPPFVTVPPLPIATAHEPPVPPRKPVQTDMRPTVKPTDFVLHKSFYLPNPPPTTEPNAFLMTGNRDRGSYVIKHYKDLLNAAVDDDERSSDFLPYHTTNPPRESFDADGDKHTFKPRDEEDDYDNRFRKDVLTRFVDNFNQNSEQFKIDFPILYNTSVLHRKEGGLPAASRTYFKRLYHDGVATKANGLVKKPCEPNCEMTVELSPAYELHYYVPNQEEREEQEPRTPPAPYRYGL